MVDASLVKYIQDNHAKGYSLQTLRAYLLQQGYSPLDIESAIKEAYTPSHINKHKLLIIISILGALIVLIAGIFLAINILQDDTVITSSLSPGATSISPTTQPTFSVRFQGAEKSTPVIVKYDILQSGSIIDTLQESVDAYSGQRTYRINTLPQGTYTIQVTVTHKDTPQVNTYILTVETICGDNVCDINEVCPQDCATCGDDICEEGEICLEDCNTDPTPTQPTQPTDPIDQTPTDTCGDNYCDASENPTTCSADCSIPVCGDAICEQFESSATCPEDCRQTSGSITQMTNYQITQHIKEVVERDGANAASKECDKITTQSKIDHCYDQVARNSQEGAYCKFIKAPNTRDECYLTYAYNSNDFSVCEKMIDPYKKETCTTLAEVFG